MNDPLNSAIADAIALIDANPLPTDENLNAIGVRLALAHAATEDEINQLAVESFQETIDDLLNEKDEGARAYLFDHLQTGLMAYEVQLLLDGEKG